jgi:hypothetical protein
MTVPFTAEDEAAFQDATSQPNPEDAPVTSAPAAALAASRVDLIDLIRNGIPEAEHVPGCAPWLRKGKRYLIPAPAGTGKSLAGLVVAVTTIEHGGTAIILDVENGADEYARRLEDILAARDHDGSLADACQQRLQYHTWPTLSLQWTSEDWAAAVAGADLVIFDSSRFTLSSLGLGEDSNDDYSQFITSLVIPLAKAGTTTIILDNTGHSDKDRARGASTKADLNEVVYALKEGKPFDRNLAGHVRLERTRSRFSGLPRELHMHLGGNTYTAPTPADPPAVEPGRDFRPTELMERTSKAVEATVGLSKRAIRRTVGGNTEAGDLALELLIAERYIDVRIDRQAHHHHPIKPYRRAHDPLDRDHRDQA